MNNSPFIRGGQTALHEYRMSIQVVKTLTWIVFGIAFVFMAAKLILNVSIHEIYQWLIWHWARFLYLASNRYEQEITLHDYDWAPYVTHTGAIVDHAGMTATKDKVESLILAGSGMGLVIGLITATHAAGYFLWRGARLQKSKHLRGSRLLPAPELIQQVKAFNKSRKGERHPRGEGRLRGKRPLAGMPYTIAGIPYPTGAPMTHVMICGTTGTGKTTLFADLIEQIRRQGDRAIIYDKMGGFVGRYYDPAKDVICNPFDARTPHWSVFSEGRKSSDFEMMAKALIPEQKGMVDPFWILAARILFSKVADGLRIAGNPTNEQLVSQLLKIDLSEMAALLKNTAAQSIIDEQSPKTALSVRAVMTAYLSCLEHLPDDPAAGDPRAGGPGSEPFSIRGWIEDDERDGFMFLTSRGDMHESIKGLTTCWLEIAVNSLLSLEQSRERKIWIILDEVPSLFNIPSLQPGMAESRQFGGCFVLGLQVWSAMRDIYGTNGAETLSGLARTRLVLSTPDKATADWCSQALGNAEKTELQETLSYGAHDMRDGVSLAARNELRPIVLPTEIMSLPDLTGFLRLPQGFPVARFTIKPNTTPIKSRAFVERPVVDRPIEAGKPAIMPQPAAAGKPGSLPPTPTPKRKPAARKTPEPRSEMKEPLSEREQPPAVGHVESPVETPETDPGPKAERKPAAQKKPVPKPERKPAAKPKPVEAPASPPTDPDEGLIF